jgi:hypothetical protein
MSDLLRSTLDGRAYTPPPLYDLSDSDVDDRETPPPPVLPRNGDLPRDPVHLWSEDAEDAMLAAIQLGEMPPSPAANVCEAAIAAASRPRGSPLVDGVSSSSDSERLCDSSQPPAHLRLYRHALESIFAWCTLSELHGVLSVSHSWSVAVLSMRSIHAVMDRAPVKKTRPLAAIVATPLSKHLGSIGTHATPAGIDPESLRLMTQRLTHLRLLYSSLLLKDPSAVQMAALAFPPRLHTLFLHIPSPVGAPPTTQNINAALATVGGIASLTNLGLELPEFDPEICFAPLARLGGLKQCSMHWNGDIEPARLTDAQVDDFRSLAQLQILSLGQLNEPLLRKLVVELPGRKRCWQYMGAQSDTTDATADLMSTVCTLYRFVCWSIRCESFDFLQRMRSLREMDLTLISLSSPGRAALRDSGRHLSRLTSLTFRNFFYTDAELTTLLTPMRALRILHLKAGPQEFASLGCLSIRTLQLSLRQLTLDYVYLRVEEIPKLWEAKRLERLTLNCAFFPSTSEESRAQIRAQASAHLQLQLLDVRF